MTTAIKVNEFHTEPTIDQVRTAMCKSVGDGEISGSREFSTNWGGIFNFELNSVDIGTTEVYNVWNLTATFKGMDHGED